MSRIFLSPRLRFIAIAASATALAALTGCAGMTGTAIQSASSVSIPAGKVHGGQQPISGAKVYLYAVSTNGYKSASTNLDTVAPGYVTTDGGGGFSFSGLGLSCPSGNPQLYFLSVGGNPGQATGTNNTAISLIAPLGPCSGVNSSTFVVVNEVSTIAAATALQAFALDGADVGTSSTNTVGLTNAAASVFSMINAGSGTALATTPASMGGNGTVPQAELNTLGNILTPCVNSISSTSSACTSLFGYATTPAGAVPTDTFTAALNIARFPGNQVANLFSLAMSNAPFQPALAAAPNDFSVGITFTGNNVVQPGQLVIDAQGNVWSANCRSCANTGTTDFIAKFGPNGNFINQYSNSGIHQTQGLAIDLSGNVWSANSAVSGGAADQITKMLSTGSLVASYSGSDLAGPQAVAIDANNNAWVTSANNSNILEFNPSVVETGGSPYAQSLTGIGSPAGIGFDDTGNVFVASTGSSAILKLNSTGALISPFGGYTGSGIASPTSIAIDSTGDVWTFDADSNNISAINNTGGAISGSPFAAGLYQATLIAFDGSNTAYIANCRAGCQGSGSTAPDNIIRLNSAGQRIDSSDGLQNSLFKGTGSTAIDAAGSVWIADSFGSSITKMIGLATPVITPLAAASSTGKLGMEP